LQAEIKEILISSRNVDKIREIKDLLEHLPIKVMTIEEIPQQLPEIDEDADTLLENARKKAKTIAELTNLPTLADDTGLFVDALKGEPGLFSARYAGENCSYADNREKLLQALAGMKEEWARKAEFRTVVILYLPNGKEIVAEGVVKGSITEEERGGNGFGYDAIFQAADSEKTFAEMSDEEKNRISHRALALKDLVSKIQRDI
jgi:XTP/dITP diphosphohydrolase